MSVPTDRRRPGPGGGGRIDPERDCRLAVVARAEARFADFAGAVVSAVLDALPEYGQGRSAVDLEDVVGGIRRSSSLCLRMIAEDRALVDDERLALRLTGAQRARQGISKRAVLESVKVGTRAGRRFLLACADPDTEPEVLTAAFRSIATVIDRFEDEALLALEEGHDEGSRSLRAAADRGEAVLVDRLLERRFQDRREVLEHAAEVGLSPSLAAYVAAVVVAPSGRDGAEVGRAVRRLRPRLKVAIGPLRATPRPHVPLLVQGARPEPLDAVVPLLERVGVEASAVVVYAERAVSLVDVVEPYASMRTSLPFVEAATGRPGAVPSLLTRFHRMLCTGAPAERVELIGDVLGPLDRLGEKERADLLETLDALYEVGGSTAALGRRLHLHKNTVFRRLRRVREVVGLDVRRPAERLVIDAVLRMRHVAGFDAVPSADGAGSTTAPARSGAVGP